MDMTIPQIPLNDETTIPQFGLGVWQVPQDDTERVVSEAFELGYRHIDTAQMYGNERQIGEAISHAGLARHDVFVTSKLSNHYIGYDAALTGFDRTLQELGFDQLDLFLIHWPLPTLRDYVETWRAFERIYAEGRVRAIGVSNFQISHLERLAAECDIVPAVNQVEANPYLTQEPLRAYHAEHGILTEAWSPIALGKVVEDRDLNDIADAHGRTPAQVVLRWHLQLGNIVFPKSVTPARIKENFEIFDFSLSEEEMARISSLNRDERVGPDPDVFDFVPKGVVPRAEEVA